MPRRKQQLTREGEPKQTTPKGLEIPIITEGEFFNVLGKVVKKAPKPKPEPSESERA